MAFDRLEPFINRSFESLAKLVGAYEQRMSMSREVIAGPETSTGIGGIWTAKKRYILNCWDIEGVQYKEPKLKIMGIEAVKSSTPAPCREKIKEALPIIMNGDEKMLNNFIQEFRKEFMELSPEDIAYPRSCNGILRYTDDASLFKKSTPIHVKGAILFNWLIEKNKLTNKYQKIMNGEKIKFVSLKMPNLYQSTAFSFITEFPKELDIRQLVDYDLQFEGAFVSPLRFITDKIQWKIDSSYGTQGTLEDFFN